MNRPIIWWICGHCGQTTAYITWPRRMVDQAASWKINFQPRGLTTSDPFRHTPPTNRPAQT